MRLMEKMTNRGIFLLKKRLILLSVPFFVFLFVCNLQAQAPAQSQDKEKVSFIYPLDVPLSLSGDYGELRGNHFHGGIDFRVGGVVGAPIKATADGYVSKITVSPTGYGNALYITHPNGYVSVHGHLLKYADHIQKFVREYQYENELLLILAPTNSPLSRERGLRMPETRDLRADRISILRSGTRRISHWMSSTGIISRLQTKHLRFSTELSSLAIQIYAEFLSV